ncbi:ankyrin repeat domain-containing protein [Candidatus Albibeggiatoa sp. nov. NOAA]|uniref:ankyrin repeat domain-containing protein n=1 Tax=Candidatus Albibeggiatoa sp. nov. NOAA TaxID=3162724 RepID=UPI0032F2E7A6|nr:ankyrin repeat domain-containing protein [Thiotrichaceae bacterium]
MNSQLTELFTRYTLESMDFIGIDLQDVNQHGAGEDRLLHIASRWGLLDDVNVLLKNGASVHTRGDMSLTPLHYAVEAGHLGIVKRLLEAGAVIDCQDEFGETPLDKAKRLKRKDVLNLLKEYKMFNS